MNLYTRIVSLCAAAILVNSVVAAPVSEIPYLTKNESFWRAWLPGVIRPDAGTIEITMRVDKPISEFGNSWEYVLDIPPGSTLKKSGVSLLGLTSIPLPGKGITAVMRTGESTYYANIPDLRVEPGKKINLAISWGSALTLYVNGEQAARTPMKDTPPESVWPDHLRMPRYSPWNPQAVRVSTIERAGGQLASDPESAFVRDDNTSLVANDLSKPSQLFHTAWHTEKAVALIKPVFRPEKQCDIVGERPVFPVVAVNRSAAPKTVQIDLSVTSLSGMEPKSSHFTIDLPTDTSAQVHELPLTGLENQSYYTITYRIRGEGVPDINGVSQTAVFPRDRKEKEGAMSRFYGVHHENHFAPEVWAKIDSRTSRAWAGGNVFLWWKVEPVEGEFNWKEADAYVRECQSAGMEVLGVLGYPSRWAAADPGEEHKAKKGFYCPLPSHWKPASMTAWARYVRETVRHFKGRVKYWEIYNEINFRPPSFPCALAGATTEEYLELQKIAFQEAKAADSDCMVTSSGFSADADKSLPVDFIRLGGAAFCDIYNVHGYSGVEGAAPFVKPFMAAKPGAPIWQTEHMWFTMTDQKKRVYLDVAWPIFFAEAGYSRFFNMGVIGVFFDRITLSPNLDQYVIGVFQNEMYPCETFAGRISFVGDTLFDLRHQFRRTDGTMLTVLGSETTANEVYLAETPKRIRDLFGHPVPVTAEEGGVRLLITNVAYVVSDTSVKVRKIIAKSRMNLMVNGQFEEVDGDVAMAGIETGKARHFILHEKTYDPEGWIRLTGKARNGSYAMQVHSSGKGRVVILQETSVPKAGTYVLSGYFRRLSGDAKPYLFLGNRDTKEYPQKIMEDAGADFRRLSMEVTLPAKNILPLAICWGIASGAGDVLVDDVAFEPKIP
ncbi:MAG: endo-1,4-beta-xylanase [Spirochaetota bacterium]